MRNEEIELFFNRQAATIGLPWILRGKGWSRGAKHVVIRSCQAETAERRRGKQRPRYFLKIRGRVRFKAGVAYLTLRAGKKAKK